MTNENPNVLLQLQHLRTKDRMFEYKVEKLELKIDQLMVMLKMILDKSVNPHRAKNREVTMDDIVRFMGDIVSAHEQSKFVEHDLVDDILKKGML